MVTEGNNKGIQQILLHRPKLETRRFIILKTDDIQNKWWNILRSVRRKAVIKDFTFPYIIHRNAPSNSPSKETLCTRGPVSDFCCSFLQLMHSSNARWLRKSGIRFKSDKPHSHDNIILCFLRFVGSYLISSSFSS